MRSYHGRLYHFWLALCVLVGTYTEFYASLYLRLDSDDERLERQLSRDVCDGNLSVAISQTAHCILHCVSCKSYENLMKAASQLREAAFPWASVHIYSSLMYSHCIIIIVVDAAAEAGLHIDDNSIKR